MKKIIFGVLVLLTLFTPSFESGAMARRSFEQYVAEGLVPGYTYVAKFGANPLTTDASVPEDVWEYGGTYPFSANGTFPDIGVADIISLSSSNAADTQPTLIYCLGADGYGLSQLVALDGQNRVALGTACWHPWRMENMGDTSYAGNVYLYSGTDNTNGVPSGSSVTKATIVNGNNQTQMAIYKIPRDKVGFLKRSEVGFGYAGGPSAGVEEVHFQFQVRAYGNVFKVKKEVSLLSTATSSHVDNRPFPDPIPALSDVKLTTTMTTEDIHTWGTFHLLIVDEAYLTADLLSSIDQPE